MLLWFIQQHCNLYSFLITLGNKACPERNGWLQWLSLSLMIATLLVIQVLLKGILESYYPWYIICFILDYLGDTVISSAGTISLPLVNSLNAATGQTNPVATKLSATGTSIIISFSVGLSVPLANNT